jgi:hypothetical protein
LYFLGIIAATVLLFSTILPFILHKKRNFSSVYKINLSILISCVITLTALVTFAVWYTKFNKLVYELNLQLPLLVYSLILTIAAVVSARLIAKHISSAENNYLGIKSGIHQFNKGKNELKKHLNGFKYSFILVFLPFLLLLLSFTNRTLYSIVFDNSGSMRPAIESSKFFLNDNISNLTGQADFVITSIPGQIPKRKKFNTYFTPDTLNSLFNQKKFYLPKKITSVKDADELLANSEFYQNISEFQTGIASLDVSDLGSPVQQLIWSNFLTAYKSENSYNEKKLIIISDGADDMLMAFGAYQPNVYKSSVLTEKIKDKDGAEISPDLFYDDIKFIDLNTEIQNNDKLLQGVFLKTGSKAQIVSEDGIGEAFAQTFFDDVYKDFFTKVYVDKDFLIYLLIILSLGLISLALFVNVSSK